MQKNCFAHFLCLKVCGGSETPLYHLSCADINPDTPYCVGNICTNTPDSKNVFCSLSFEFQCTSAGVFPGIQTKLRIF